MNNEQLIAIVITQNILNPCVLGNNNKSLTALFGDWRQNVMF